MTILAIITFTLACVCLPTIAVFSILQWREIRTLRTGTDAFAQLAELTRKRRKRADQTIKL